MAKTFQQGRMKKQKKNKGGGGGGGGAGEAGGSGMGPKNGGVPPKAKNVQAMPFNTEKGQHILANPGVVNAIVEKSALKPTDVVMEVGPGTGNLSVRIMDACKRLIAFELDPRMVAELKKRVIGTPAQHKLEVIVGDVIKEKNWPPFDVCVSNLPYEISSPFIFRLLEQEPLPRYAVLMFQKEFADRLVAKPGSQLYSRLSVYVQFLAKVEHLMTVKKTEFRPPPKVDSAVIRIEPHNPRPPINYAEWDGFLRIVFLKKNKTLGAIFKVNNVVNMLTRNHAIVQAANANAAQPVAKTASGGGVEAAADGDERDAEEDKDKPPAAPKLDDEARDAMRTRIDGVLNESDFANKRARNLSVEDFLALLLAFNKADIHFA